MKRRTGKTTRIIDKAIQTLFTKGEILVPFTSSFNTLKGFKRGTLILDPIEGDLDSENQRNLFARIMDRLEREHPDDFDFNEKVGRIFLKKSKHYLADNEDRK